AAPLARALRPAGATEARRPDRPRVAALPARLGGTRATRAGRPRAVRLLHGPGSDGVVARRPRRPGQLRGPRSPRAGPGLPADLHDLGSREQGAVGTGRPRAEPAAAPAARRMARRLRSPADAGAPGRGGGDRARLLRERAPPSGRSPARRREPGDGVTPFPDEVFDLASVVFEVAHADP